MLTQRKIILLLDMDNLSKEIEYYNTFKRRADEVCIEIIKAVDFREWLS